MMCRQKLWSYNGAFDEALAGQLEPSQPSSLGDFNTHLVHQVLADLQEDDHCPWETFSTVYLADCIEANSFLFCRELMWGEG